MSIPCGVPWFILALSVTSLCLFIYVLLLLVTKGRQILWTIHLGLYGWNEQYQSVFLDYKTQLLVLLSC